jgi:hypothetical protein
MKVSIVLLVSLVAVLAVTRAAHAAQMTDMAPNQQSAIERQTDGESPSADEDTKVAVQLWTIMASAGAAAVFLVLFFLRIVLGRGPVVPPSQEDAAHH